MKEEGINGTDLNANLIETFAKKAEKRSGGGTVSMGHMTFDEIAEVIIQTSEGFDRRNKTPYRGKIYALKRYFEEYGWPVPEDAIVIAGVRRTAVDTKDGFIPLAPGKIDIAAAFEMDPEHEEFKISTKERKDDTLKSIDFNSIVGIATEYGNDGNSLETIVPKFVDGIWEKIEDLQHNRVTGMIIVTPHITLWCRQTSINDLQSFPLESGSVKMLEAIKIAKYLV